MQVYKALLNAANSLSTCSLKTELRVACRNRCKCKKFNVWFNLLNYWDAKSYPEGLSVNQPIVGTEEAKAYAIALPLEVAYKPSTLVVGS